MQMHQHVTKILKIYLLCTAQDIESCFKFQEKTIHEEFVLALFGEAIDEAEGEYFGGLATVSDVQCSRTVLEIAQDYMLCCKATHYTNTVKW